MALDDDLTRLTIFAGDEIAGMVQFSEEPDPKYRSASLDLFVRTSHQRRGLGSEALRLVIDYLTRERGHHRLVIDPAADNEAAIACYAKSRLPSPSAECTPKGNGRRVARPTADGTGRAGPNVAL